RQAQGPRSTKEIAQCLGRQDAKGLNALYFLLHKMLRAGDIDSPKKGSYTAKDAKDAQDAQVARIAKCSVSEMMTGYAASSRRVDWASARGILRASILASNAVSFVRANFH